ncbi:MAG: hypothetical protein ISN29_11710, partial [Gammaproteobacteria bacterium AqS3]|nr:hypothetical protein [Gammaproteobacteria bacterium AqS3]
GEVVDAAGYEVFFIYCALLGLPAIALSIWLHRRRLRHGDETPDALETLSDPARNSAPDAPPGRP